MKSKLRSFLLTLIVLIPFFNRKWSLLSALSFLSLPHFDVESISNTVLNLGKKKSATYGGNGCCEIYSTLRASSNDLALISCGKRFFLKCSDKETDILSLVSLLKTGLFFFIRLEWFLAHCEFSFVKPKAQWFSPLLLLDLNFASERLIRVKPRFLHSLWKTSLQTPHLLLSSSKDIPSSQCILLIIKLKSFLKYFSILSNAFMLQSFKLQVIKCQ